MTPPPAPAQGRPLGIKGPIGISLQGAQTAFVLCSRIPPDHNPPYPPLVSALRLVCCLRIQIWLSLSMCTRVHTVYSHMGPLVWGCWARVD